MNKKLSQPKRRRAIGQQLRFLRRNLKHMEKLASQVSLSKLNRRHDKELLVIQEVYRPQSEMYETKSRRIDDRIVSISQPQVRPIVRDKAGAAIEFGAKLSASVVGGYVC